MSRSADVLIVGAGMAGASLAAEIAGHVSVLVLEAEAHHGYHATGRSAAFWSESYGGPSIQPLTSASGPFLADPPSDFSERPFLGPRQAIHLADREGEFRLRAMRDEFAASEVPLEMLGRPALGAKIPGLKPGWDLGLFEPTCSDIDVGALHQAYLRMARRQGATFVNDARVKSIARNGGTWTVSTPHASFEAPVIANAAGAWADGVASLAGIPPLGIQPYRRTLVQLRVDPPVPADLPLVIDALGRFYFKPEAGGRLWLSPHDESPCEPCDSAPEEYDVALAVDRLQQVVDWKVERVERSWAGLRSFAPDRLPVYGYAPGRRDFFWCAGQGGFGIQTAPAGAKLAASLLLGTGADPMIAGLDPAPYLAERFAN